MHLIRNKRVLKSSFEVDPGFPSPHRGQGPGPKGPWALWPQYLGGNSELRGRSKNALYEELAGYCGVSEAATAP